MVYDKEKEDAPFVAEEESPSSERLNEEQKKVSLKIKKSVNSKNQKSNPVSTLR